MITISTIVMVAQMASNGVGAFICFGSAGYTIYVLFVTEGVEGNDYV